MNNSQFENMSEHKCNLAKRWTANILLHAVYPTTFNIHITENGKKCLTSITVIPWDALSILTCIAKEIIIHFCKCLFFIEQPVLFKYKFN